MYIYYKCYILNTYIKNIYILYEYLHNTYNINIVHIEKSGGRCGCDRRRTCRGRVPGGTPLIISTRTSPRPQTGHGNHRPASAGIARCSLSSDNGEFRGRGLGRGRGLRGLVGMTLRVLTLSSPWLPEVDGYLAHTDPMLGDFYWTAAVHIAIFDGHHTGVSNQIADVTVVTSCVSR